MPMLTTSVKGSPSAAVMRPSRRPSANAAMRSRLSRTPAVTACPSTFGARSGEGRSAVCSTARSSVLLIFSPSNMAARWAGRPAASASSRSRVRLSASMLVLEKSSSRPSASAEKPSNRPASPSNRLKIGRSRTLSALSVSLVQMASMVMLVLRSVSGLVWPIKKHPFHLDKILLQRAPATLSQAHALPNSTARPLRWPLGSGFCPAAGKVRGLMPVL